MNGNKHGRTKVLDWQTGTGRRSNARCLTRRTDDIARVAGHHWKPVEVVDHCGVLKRPLFHRRRLHAGIMMINGNSINIQTVSSAKLDVFYFLILPSLKVVLWICYRYIICLKIYSTNNSKLKIGFVSFMQRKWSKTTYGQFKLEFTKIADFT